MKKIENMVIEVILMAEFDCYGDIKEGQTIEEVAVGAVEDTHGIFLGGEDGFVGSLEAVELLDNKFVVEFAESVVVGEGEVRDGAMALEVAFERLGVGDASDEEELGVGKREPLNVEGRAARTGLALWGQEWHRFGIVYKGEVYTLGGGGQESVFDFFLLL